MNSSIPKDSSTTKPLGIGGLVMTMGIIIAICGLLFYYSLLRSRSRVCANLDLSFSQSNWSKSSITTTEVEKNKSNIL